MSDDTIASLEERYSRLERRVFGDEPFESDENQIAELLSQAASMLEATSAAKEKIGLATKRLDELDAYLDADFEGNSRELTAAKAEVVLASADSIGHRVRQMKQLHKAVPVLDEREMSQAAQLAPRLSELVALTADESAMAEAEATETRALLQRYNLLINQLSRTFVLWDAAVTAAEILANPVKPIDQ